LLPHSFPYNFLDLFCTGIGKSEDNTYRYWCNDWYHFDTLSSLQIQWFFFHSRQIQQTTTSEFSNSVLSIMSYVLTFGNKWFMNVQWNFHSPTLPLDIFEFFFDSNFSFGKYLRIDHLRSYCCKQHHMVAANGVQ
jgi:hypothetical protein